MTTGRAAVVKLRKVALAVLAGVVVVAGTAVRVSWSLTSIAGAAAVTIGVAVLERHGHGWAWIAGGAFGLVAGYERNRLAGHRPPTGPGSA